MDTEVRKTFATNLKIACLKANLETKDLADKIPVALTTATKWRSGENYPGKKNMRRIEEILGVTEKQLLTPGIPTPYLPPAPQESPPMDEKNPEWHMLHFMQEQVRILHSELAEMRKELAESRKEILFLREKNEKLLEKMLKMAENGGTGRERFGT